VKDDEVRAVLDLDALIDVRELGQLISVAENERGLARILAGEYQEVSDRVLSFPDLELPLIDEEDHTLVSLRMYCHDQPPVVRLPVAPSAWA